MFSAKSFPYIQYSFVLHFLGRIPELYRNNRKMAKQKSVRQAASEKKLDLTYWAEGVVKRLKTNFDTQNIFPYGYPGPYPGAARKQTKNGKFEGSTGDAFRSIYAKVYNAAGGNTEKISFFFNYYLYFVDMGVGAGQPIEAVDRSDKAKYNRLYKTWKDTGDRQSRPAFAMEFRYQLFKLSTIVSAFYGRLITNGIVFSITDEIPDDGVELIK